MEQALAGDEPPQGDVASESDYEDSEALPRLECIALDRQVWEFPLTRRQRTDRLVRILDTDRAFSYRQSLEFEERYARERSRKIAAEARARAAEERLARIEEQRAREEELRKREAE